MRYGFLAALLLLAAPASAQFQGPPAPYMDNSLTGGSGGTGMARDASNANLPTALQNLGVVPTVTSYGARGDVKSVTCTAVTSGTSLTCTGAAFVAADVGKHIEVPSAGTVTNTGGVTAVAVSSAGTGITSLPSCSITGAGGSGATCSPVMVLLSATVNAAGSGCVGSSGVLNVGAAVGTGSQPQVSVTFSAGAVSAVTGVLDPGALTTLSATTVAALGGGCSGVTLNLTMGVGSINVTAAGSGYPGGGSTTASLTGGGGTPATLGAVTVANTASTLSTTIATVVDGDHITMGASSGSNPNASTVVTWGTDSSAAIKSALDANQAVSFPTATQDVRSPTGVYFANDIVLNSGNTLLGSAADGYGTDTAINRPIIQAMQGAATILNPTGKSDIVIRGIELNGNSTGADCIAANDTGRRIVLDTVTAIGCNRGFGSSGLYSHVATIINSRFVSNTTGINNPIDAKIVAGSVTGNVTGAYLGSGAAGTAFIGTRVEWNTGAGIVCDGCFLLNMVGVEFDRNYAAGLQLIAACRGVTLTGGWFNRNSRINNLAVGQAKRSHIYVGGTCNKVKLAPGVLEAGRDDDGTAALTPAYFLDTNTTITNYSLDLRTPVAIGSDHASEVTVGAFTGGGAVPVSISYPLTGTTGSIGGSSVGAGACTSGTASITNVTTGMAISVDPVTYPGDGLSWNGYVSAAGTVTVKVCNYTSGSLTPTSSAYNVRAIQ